MHHPTDRIAHTTVFVTPVVEHWQEQDGITKDVVGTGMVHIKEPLLLILERIAH